MPTGSTGSDSAPVRRVLVTGASGYIAAATIRALQLQGHYVRATVRRTDSSSSVDLIEVPHINRETVWGRAVEGIDTVVHLAARVHVRRELAPDPLAAYREINVAGTAKLVEASRRAGVETFVFVSTIAVVAERSDRALDESAVCAPASPYAVSKHEAELAVMAEADSMRVVIVRPPMVYGRLAPGNFALLTRAVRHGWPLPLKNVKNQRSFVFVDNLADLLRAAVEDRRASGVYHVADERPVSTPEFIRLLAHAMGRRANLVAVPLPILRACASLVGRVNMLDKLVHSLPVDDRRARRDLGWSSPWTMASALQASVPA